MSLLEKFHEQVKGFEIPSPFFVENNKLYRENYKSGDVEFISRQAPYITRYFDDVEKNNVQYELTWCYKGKIYNEILPATALSTRKEIIALANKGLSSNDRNAKYLIEYFDLYLDKNNIDKSSVVTHLGYVKNHFIHPLIEYNYRIVPPDIGEKQRLESIKTKGSIGDWIENILKPLYKHPKAIFPIVSSFASILFKEFDLTPIIVDISGSSTSGKTTVQKVCASVWGNPEGYISSMLTTNVAIERMASFLNAFPLILDDTNTAHDTKALQQIIYMFGNGTGKMRGSIDGSRHTNIWKSVMITTGENNILEYTNAQGTAARVIPITHFKLENETTNIFEFLNKNVNKYYGTIGLEFIKRWTLNREKFQNRFQQIVREYQSAVTKNPIIQRIAIHYSFIVFIAEVLNELFVIEGMAIDIDALKDLFKEIARKNDYMNRAKVLLIDILEELNANRGNIYDNFKPYNSIHAISNASGFYLTIKYVKDKLKVDEKQIREAWRNQGCTVSQKHRGKLVDYKNITHDRNTFRVIQVDSSFLEENDFVFSRKI